MNIFVGNLSFEANEGDVKKLFEGFGNVASVAIVMRKEKKTPKSRGFGFVQMPDEQQARAAIGALNGKEFMGRVLNVNPARPKGQKAMVWPPIAKAKTEAHRESKLEKKAPPKFKAKAEEYPQKKRERGKTWFSPVFNKHLALKDEQVRPLGQPGTYRGGRRTRSYMKRRGLTGMQEEAKPWKKPAGDAKPWSKSSARPQKSRFKGRRKPGGYKR